jgi:hypothetical protein
MKKTIIGILLAALVSVVLYVVFFAPSDGETAASRLKRG